MKNIRHIKKQLMILALGILILLLTIGCGQEKTKISQPEKKTIEITDSMGRNLTVPFNPQRIVSVNSDVSEVICALGSQDKIVGVADTSKFPPLLKEKTKVGAAFTPNVEKILELKPDIVFGYGKFLKQEIAQQIESAGIPVVYLDCYKVKTMDKDVKTLGSILNKEKQSKEYMDFFDKYLKEVSDKVKNIPEDKKVKVYIEGYTDYSTNASGSAAAEMLEYAGGKNIAASENKPYPTVSSEWVIAQNPQVIIKAASSSTVSGYGASDEGMKKLWEKIVSRTGWQQIQAVKDGRVYIISSEIYTGPRASVGIFYFAKWMYPDLFKDINPENINKEFLHRFYGLDAKGAWVYPNQH
jgi:iron complex transport system substrate-binding protein